MSSNLNHSVEIENSLKQANQWIESDWIDKADREELISLVQEKNSSEILERFYKQLEFGTGGMRSIIGLGTNRINKYTVRKAAQALALTMQSQAVAQKVAISYDSREFSFDFAKEAARVLASYDIKVLIFKRLNPVPLLSFSIRHHGAGAGIMITASHNPAKYNGIKVYWENGAQVTSPIDQLIINQFNQLDFDLKKDLIEFDKGLENNQIEWLCLETEDAYFESIKRLTLRPELCEKSGKNMHIIYTPLHGAALNLCTRALKQIGLSNFDVVNEQANPDHHFSTVSSPNPENPEALDMALKLLEKRNADMAIGSDPDGDRIGVVLKHQDQPVYLSGNQIGTLMLHYLLTTLKEKGDLKDYYFINTIVTSKIQNQIAKSMEVENHRTLTGFKWICRKMDELKRENSNAKLVFATEESYGYLNHEFIRDKDGVSAIALMGEIALWYKEQGMNLVDALDKIYDEYGYYHEELININYEGKEGSEKINRIMNFFREFNKPSLNEMSLHKKEDYLLQETLEMTTQESKTMTGLPKSNVLCFKFQNRDELYMRPSGTEPKIKFYLLFQEKKGSLNEKKNALRERIVKLTQYIKNQVELL